MAIEYLVKSIRHGKILARCETSEQAVKVLREYLKLHPKLDPTKYSVFYNKDALAKYMEAL